MAQTRDFKCPNCGGNIEFDSKTQGMKCPYCDTEFDMAALAGFDDELSNSAPSDMEWHDSAHKEWEAGEADHLAVYACKSCGGEIIADDNTAMTTCPYCNSPIAMRSRFAGELKPDYVLPFKLDKKAAKEAYQRHIQGKKLLPAAFASGNHIDEIKGIYLPYWLFDADISGNYKYEAVKTRIWSDARYNYTEKRYYAVKREGELSFEKVPVDASSKTPDDFTESIEPFDFSELKPFTTAYLSGWMADKYDVSQDSCKERANERIKSSADNDFFNSVTGFDSVYEKQSSIVFNSSSCSYALLPVWLLNTTWEGEQYMFAMNGQTGKFVGNLPMDKKAYGKWFFIYWVISFLICLAVSFVLSLI